ncbi:putative BMP-2-inducible kinase-like protein [Apostichopus japonicus]|uniref:Putative BMP-2-inducible kinase-like protein n=2 Tax=Stichopus japonicus TaxID=307972 RepID=A0A2G8JBH4_STIJA|nr:putative BMP-2-inducible kinase-like protein [Apostichopus japonicus]
MSDKRKAKSQHTSKKHSAATGNPTPPVSPTDDDKETATTREPDLFGAVPFTAMADGQTVESSVPTSKRPHVVSTVGGLRRSSRTSSGGRRRRRSNSNSSRSSRKSSSSSNSIKSSPGSQQRFNLRSSQESLDSSGMPFDPRHGETHTEFGSKVSQNDQNSLLVDLTAPTPPEVDPFGAAPFRPPPSKVSTG